MQAPPPAPRAGTAIDAPAPSPQIACIRTPRAGAPQLFLSHGVTDNAASLAAAHRHWKERYDVTSVDARGHGLSARFTPEQLADPIGVMAADLIGLIEAREHRAPRILVGHSMGGAVSAAAAAERPDLIDAVILEDPAWLSQEQSESYLSGGRVLAERMERIRSDPARALGENREGFPAWDPEEACAWLQAKIQVDLSFLRSGTVSARTPWDRIAAALAVPTLLVTSDGPDVLIGAKGLARVRALGNPRIRTALVPGASHCVRRDQAGAFHALCDQFLAEVVA